MRSTSSFGWERSGVNEPAWPLLCCCQIPANGLGLVLAVRHSALDCALSSKAFFCTASRCNTQLDHQGGCYGRLAETVVSAPVFVKGNRDNDGNSRRFYWAVQ